MKSNLINKETKNIIFHKQELTQDLTDFEALELKNQKSKINFHFSHNAYWRDKIKQTTQIQNSLNKLVRRISKLKNIINLDISFYATTKHNKAFFTYRLNLSDSSTGTQFHTVNVSNNYIKPFVEAVNRSMNFIEKHYLEKKPV